MNQSIPFSSTMLIHYILLLLPLSVVQSYVYCPKGCVCSDNNVDYPAIDCSNAQLPNIPALLNPRLKSLKLQGNSLTVISLEEMSYYQELEYLDLSDNKILQIERGAFYRQTKLKHLNLRGNMLRSLEIETFNGLVQLTSLDVSANSIARLPTSVFVESRALQTLNGSHNDLAEVSTGALTGLDQLTHLYLGNNKLVSIPHMALQASSALQLLDLSSNSISRVDNESFVLLSQLQSLDLSYNEIEHVHSNGLIGLQNLRSLSMDGNRLLAVPQAFRLLTELSRLQLSANLFETLSTSSFEGLASLRSLVLSRCMSLKRVELMAFSGLFSLVELELNGNSQLEFIDSQSFERPNLIERFSIDNCNLRSLSVDLLDWGQITQLQIQGNPWKCDCLLGWMPEHLAHLADTTGVNQAQCSSPSSFRGQSVLSLDVSSLGSCSPIDTDMYVRLALFASGLLAVTLLIAILIVRYGTCTRGDHEGEVKLRNQSPAMSAYNFDKRADLSAILSGQHPYLMDSNGKYAPMTLLYANCSPDATGVSQNIYLTTQIPTKNSTPAHYMTSRSSQSQRQSGSSAGLPQAPHNFTMPPAPPQPCCLNTQQDTLYCSIADSDSPRSLRSLRSDEGAALLPNYRVVPNRLM